MISLVLVGCAHIHTPGFVKMLQKRTDAKVKCVWDHDGSRAERWARELSAAAVQDVCDIWRDQEIQAVIVCSQTNRHLPLVTAAANAGKHLFVEKPLGLGAKDAWAMADAIRRAGVKFQTGYMSRSRPVVQFLKNHVQAGTFGKITRVRASNCHGGAIHGWFDGEWRWMADVKQAGCGAFGDLGTHCLDILLWLFGEVEAVVAVIDNGTARYPDCDETGEAIIRFKNGLIGTLAAAWDDLANPVQYLISGTKAHAAIINDQLYMTCPRLGLDGKEPVGADQLPPGWPHALELFLDAVTGKDVSLVSVREAAYCCQVMEAIYESARRGAWVRLT